MERPRSHWVGAAVCVLGDETGPDAGSKGGQTSEGVRVGLVSVLSVKYFAILEPGLSQLPFQAPLRHPPLPGLR